jgi:hypothetical protein
MIAKQIAVCFQLGLELGGLVGCVDCFSRLHESVSRCGSEPLARHGEVYSPTVAVSTDSHQKK